ncbi:MAG TPA: DUF420 domain-containing protein [Sedimenticola sp.]|nr:DUF420 domain-containing protein [Sedimenticola sp.]
MKVIPLLPHLQAVLNILTICLVSIAYYHIRRENRTVHRRFMLAALAVSAVFMVSYLTYHSQVGNVKFAGEGAIRPIYFTILASHVILAALIVPMVLTTLTFALRGSFGRHRRVARWTLPLWLYVCASGVAVYLMAFHVYPPRVGLS